ncbi:MAG: hypothetical protein WC850_04420 [Candidatus Gracilibacteria bacterium]
MSNKTKCPFCGEDINKSDKVCPICAEELPNKEEKKIKEKNSTTISAKLTKNREIASQIKNHLEFFGFDIEVQEGTKDFENIFIIGRSEKRSNVTINILNENTILATSQYSIEKTDTEKKLLKIYEIINDINTKSFITKWTYSKDNEGESSISIEVYINKYEKIDFGKKMEIMEEEIRTYLNLLSDIE